MTKKHLPSSNSHSYSSGFNVLIVGSLPSTTLHPLLPLLGHLLLLLTSWFMISTHTTGHHNDKSVDPNPELNPVVDSQHRDNDAKKSDDGANNGTNIACAQPRLGCRRWSCSWCCSCRCTRG